MLSTLILPIMKVCTFILPITRVCTFILPIMKVHTLILTLSNVSSALLREKVQLQEYEIGFYFYTNCDILIYFLNTVCYIGTMLRFDFFGIIIVQYGGLTLRKMIKNSQKVLKLPSDVAIKIKRRNLAIFLISKSMKNSFFSFFVI